MNCGRNNGRRRDDSRQSAPVLRIVDRMAVAVGRQTGGCRRCERPQQVPRDMSVSIRCLHSSQLVQLSFSDWQIRRIRSVTAHVICIVGEDDSTKLNVFNLCAS